MTNLADLTTAQLTTIIAIKEQIEALQAQIDQIADDGEIPAPFIVKPRTKGHGGMSAAGRARIAAAQKARWAKIKGNGTIPEPAKKKGHRKMSAAGRAQLAAAAKARWAKAKAEGKTKL